MELIKGTAAITKAIASIQSRGKKLDADIQHAGLSILSHATEHGDTTLADKLLGAMPKGSRKLALVEWMLAFGQVRLLKKEVAEENARILAGATFALDRTKTLNLASAEETPWYDCKPEKEVFDAFDVQAAVAALMGKIAKAQKAGVPLTNLATALDSLNAITKTVVAGIEKAHTAEDVSEEDALNDVA